MSRREFLQVLAAAAATGFTFDARQAFGARTTAELYEVPPFGNVHLLHFTDCHAQLLPVYFREPSFNIGVGVAESQPPHIVGDAFLKRYGFQSGSPEAYAFTDIQFEQAAHQYGKVGGFAHLATLIKRLRAERPGALLLDGGDTWQGSATALWTKGQDMIDACKLLGVDIMTGHWDFTYGAAHIKSVVDTQFKGHTEFLAQNVRTTDFGDAVFEPYTIREMNGVPVAIIGQAFPYTPIANPRHFVSEWSFGIQEENMQNTINEVRAKGAHAVILLSHNGMDVDLKMASRVSGIDVILGGHTHDGVPTPVMVKNRSGATLVTNAGSSGKFLAVVDLNVKGRKVVDVHYKLLPIFSNLLPADPAMAALIEKHRAPFKSKLEEKLAITDGLLYRRGNFNGSIDQLIIDALMEVRGAEIAFSPGFRWGSTILPGQPITMEHLMDQTAITYPYTTLRDMTGELIKSVLEDIADNLFNPDPYLQQGGDMVRVGGLTYTLNPKAKMGSRIDDMRINGKLIEASKKYKVAGWAPVEEGVLGEPIWDVMAKWLRDQKVVKPRALNMPHLIGMESNQGRTY